MLGTECIRFNKLLLCLSLWNQNPLTVSVFANAGEFDLMGTEEEVSVEQAAAARRERLKALRAAQELLSAGDDDSGQADDNNKATDDDDDDNDNEDAEDLLVS